MNPVGALQCLPSRGQQCVVPEVDLRQCIYITVASGMRMRQPTLALNPRADVTRNPKRVPVVQK